MEQIKYDVFLSYSRKDYLDERKSVIPGNVVSKIKDALTAAGITYWFDEEGMYSGSNFTEKIVDNIEVSQIFVFLSTENANKSRWTCKEIASADEFGKYIIPVRIDSTPYNKKVMFRIADLSYIDYFSNPEKGIEDLIKSIKNYLAELAAEEERKKAEIGKAAIRYTISKPIVIGKATSVFKFYSNENCQIFKEGKLVCSIEGMSDEPYYLPVPHKGDYRFKGVNAITGETKIIKAHIEENEEKELEIEWEERKLYEHDPTLSANDPSALFNIISDEKECTAQLFPFTKEKSDYLISIGQNRWPITTKKSRIQGKTIIAFAGDISAGKTSIVNRILSQDNPNFHIQPFGTKAKPSNLYYISGYSGFFYQFITPDNKKISEETFMKQNNDIIENDKGWETSLIQHFVVINKNPSLANLCILDISGFCFKNKEIAHRTISVINECDALFWVMDINMGTINKSLISLFKEHFKKTLFVVINKVDTKVTSEVNKMEDYIKKTLCASELKIDDFIRFSSKTPLADIMNPIKSVMHNISKNNSSNEII